MRNLMLVILLVLGTAASSVGQTTVQWYKLRNVSFEKKYIKKYDTYFKLPKFGDDIKALEGKSIQIKGYIIPVDTEKDYLVLSANPFSSCFFCGAAGPETVMEIKSKKPLPELKMDQVVTFKGKLKLNDKDVHQLNYILENAQLVR